MFSMLPVKNFVLPIRFTTANRHRSAETHRFFSKTSSKKSELACIVRLMMRDKHLEPAGRLCHPVEWCKGLSLHRYSEKSILKYFLNI